MAIRDFQNFTFLSTAKCVSHTMLKNEALADD
jgi:hypothetical protein